MDNHHSFDIKMANSKIKNNNSHFLWRKKHNHSVFLCWQIFFFNLKNLFFNFVIRFFLKKWAKLVNLKSGNQKIPKLPKMFCWKIHKILSEKMYHWASQWNGTQEAHTKLTHINQSWENQLPKKKKKKKTNKKKAKIKKLTTNNKNHIPNFPKLREREKEREFLLYLSLFTGLLCFVSCVCSACALTATMNFSVSFKKKNTSWEEVQPIRVFFCCCRDHPDFHPFFPPSFRPPPSLSHLGQLFWRQFGPHFLHHNPPH